MVAYDEKVLFEFAERLYGRASRVVLSYTVFGAIVGLGAAAGVTQGRMGGTEPFYVVLGALFAAVGYARALEIAFRLRLQAQTTLCQAKIEANTRLVQS